MYIINIIIILIFILSFITVYLFTNQLINQERINMLNQIFLLLGEKKIHKDIFLFRLNLTITYINSHFLIDKFSFSHSFCTSGAMPILMLNNEYIIILDSYFIFVFTSYGLVLRPWKKTLGHQSMNIGRHSLLLHLASWRVRILRKCISIIFIHRQFYFTMMDKIRSMHFLKQLTPTFLSCVLLITNKLPRGTINYY